MKWENTRNYDDIIELPHHVSAVHPQMSLADRAAQFSPFAALTGHEEAILETARLTEEFIELDEGRKEQINEKLKYLRENQAEKPEITVTYFQKDIRKNGGAYVTVRGQVKRIDEYECQVILTDGTGIAMEQIFSIEGELFPMNEAFKNVE